METPIGVIAPPTLPAGQLLDYAERADALGFAELWVFEDCFLRGGVAQAAAVLARTGRIRVGIGILPAGARNAAFACLDLATLAELFPGRLIAGIGHGTPAWMRQTGTWPASPVTLLREYFDATRALLHGERITVAGKYVRLEDVRLEQPPAVPPPLYAGVRGPRSLAAAAEVADGVILAEPVTPEYLHQAREVVGTKDIVAYHVAAVHDDAERARALVRPHLETFGEPDWAPHIAPLPFAAEFRRLRENAASPSDFARQLPDEWADQLSVAGTPDQARARLAEIPADHHVLYPAGPDPLAALENLARVLA
ncbi:LLM class flavin-dependent oxidoreductase [Amycolatopsis jiangsuensis]|uniref:Alkanesulfonate monooxygenase SsuD/methylene tetrahydromethanopterin reductase-like flavin-dependent oxidoreductase (Luciferase family) n=1 Tax=Amycolatopsis jiangsuensis TaxID=1181879 RepID=A0A840IV34_9PSEU|nr:LLM class flavin-dependent oxidoreductase [Amycolatopsis jiangsuensis]MBB4685062.1 alkanesulfonate monooxygenase SsuD/methylene tetrahydromethanopterin reductase-like flavin-dependent oxidoreductase (luciferase family) [Amycolatopsis jiangsuensis]